jgi:hypothetical protein
MKTDITITLMVNTVMNKCIEVDPHQDSNMLLRRRHHIFLLIVKCISTRNDARHSTWNSCGECMIVEMADWMKLNNTLVHKKGLEY